MVIPSPFKLIRWTVTDWRIEVCMTLTLGFLSLHFAMWFTYKIKLFYIYSQELRWYQKYPVSLICLKNGRIDWLEKQLVRFHDKHFSDLVVIYARSPLLLPFLCARDNFLLVLLPTFCWFISTGLIRPFHLEVDPGKPKGHLRSFYVPCSSGDAT